MQQDIVFQGITAPLRLQGAEAVLPYLDGIMVGWPYRCGEADPSAAPFFSIRAAPGDALLLCQSHIQEKPPGRFDPLNAVCDAIVALAFALPAMDPRLICLHAAGVAMGGRLIIFPNIRRAGKSTLSAALARAGHGLFSDDFVPLSFTADNRADGHATGIAPRLRLPLPEGVAADFRDWVATVAGPRNRQYQYLALDGQPGRGEVLPVGAFVILDRQTEPVAARLEQVTPDLAMDALLHQNFTRDRHSADILQAMAATLSDRPVFQLTYADLAGAVTCLEAAFSAWPNPAPAEPGPMRAFRLADFGDRAPVALGAEGVIRQRLGTVAVEIGETLYLADAEGRAIHRMDALSSVIWGLLEDPITPAGIVALLAEAFPETGRDRIADDLQKLLERFGREGLIEAPPVG